MLAKTQKIKDRYDELTELIVKPEIIADNLEWKKLVKERSKIEDIALLHEEMQKVEDDLIYAKEEFKKETDKELKLMFEEEIATCDAKLSQMQKQMNVLLLPKDENDDKNIIMEIRPAAGGEEASLFAGVLLDMYIRYAESKRWTVEPIDISHTELGGIKEATISIRGKNVYQALKFESGVHRVQRVPETESQGRVHTSTATVAVLPEVEDVDFEILDNDLKIDTYRSSGAGGQHINKTESAIRITHLPTGIIVACQDQRSQIKNREKAMEVLKSKLYNFYKSKRDNELCADRKNQVGTGDRCERIRTYNYPQGRVTDHRINWSCHNIEAFTNGDIDEVVKELEMADQKAKLENVG